MTTEMTGQSGTTAPGPATGSGSGAADDVRLLVHTRTPGRAVAAAALEEAAGRDDFADGPVHLNAQVTVRRHMPATDSDEHVILGICIAISGHIYCYGLTEHTAS